MRSLMWLMRSCRRLSSVTSASPVSTRVMPLLRSEKVSSMFTMRRACPMPWGSADAIWLTSVNMVCSMNSIRPSNICALLAKCRYSAASETCMRAARAAVVILAA